MQQGDQYFIPLQVKDEEGNAITPDSCADCKFKIGDLPERSYGAGTLYAQESGGEYTGYWLYPLTQADTLSLDGAVPVQGQVKFADGTVIGTPVVKLHVYASIIRSTDWAQ